MKQTSNLLLILDNADDLKLILNFLPVGLQGHILLTTRACSTVTLAERIEIKDMEPDEGALFLLRRTQMIGKNALLGAATVNDRETAKTISIELGGLPLALDQAGAFIQETMSSLDDYLDLYEKEGPKLLTERGDLPLDDHPSVAVTFSLAFQKVEEESRAAADLIRACAFLAPDAIPEEIFTSRRNELGEHLKAVTTRTMDFLTTVKEAGRFSLLKRTPKTRTLDIHRLVQQVVRGRMDNVTRHLWAEQVVYAMNVVFPPDVEDTTWLQCDRLLPHLLSCVGLIDTWTPESEKAVRLLNQAGDYLHGRSRYADAALIYKHILTIRDKVLGPEHPDTVHSLINLVSFYANQGQQADARSLYQRAFDIRNSVLVGPDHPDTAQTLNNLALLYANQGQHPEAEPLYLRALAIREKVLGPDHPDTAQTLNNLAALYRNQRHYVKAETLYQRALAIWEKVFSLNHPNVATALENYANLLWETGKRAEATQLFDRANTIREKHVRENANK